MIVSKKVILLLPFLIVFLLSIIFFKPAVTGYSIAEVAGRAFTLYDFFLISGTIASIAVILLFVFSEPDMNIHHDIKKSKVHQRVEMAHLEKFVEKAKEKGYSDHEIKEALSQYHWDRDYIDHAIAKTKL